jgi:hypothetical protein
MNPRCFKYSDEKTCDNEEFCEWKNDQAGGKCHYRIPIQFSDETIDDLLPSLPRDISCGNE